MGMARLDIPLHEACGAYHDPGGTSCLAAVIAQRDQANARLADAEALLREYYDECESDDEHQPLTEGDTIWPPIEGELVERTRHYLEARQ